MVKDEKNDPEKIKKELLHVSGVKSRLSSTQNSQVCTTFILAVHISFMRLCLDRPYILEEPLRQDKARCRWSTTTWETRLRLSIRSRQTSEAKFHDCREEDAIPKPAHSKSRKSGSVAAKTEQGVVDEGSGAEIQQTWGCGDEPAFGSTYSTAIACMLLDQPRNFGVPMWTQSCWPQKSQTSC